MKTNTTILALAFTLISGFALAQNSVQDGDWQTGTTWSSGNPISTTAVGVGNQDITVESGDTVIVGSFGNNVGLSFTANKEAYDLTIESNAVLIIYGDVTFANKAMGMIIDGTVIVIGNMTLGNKLDIASDGTLVVSGTFSKDGSANQGSYTGAGMVYAGAYDGTANSWFSNNGATGAQASLADLGPDGLDKISDFVDSGGESPLPITLGTFDLSVTNSSVDLTWTTLTEENFEYFEIQRANENMEFETIGTVNGHGDSKVAIDYMWSDESPKVGMNYYRLVSNDYDGFREVFKAKYVVFESSSKLAIFPNLANSNSTINIDGADYEDVAVTVYNMQGQIAKTLTTNSGSFELDGDLDNGLYIVELSTNGLQKRQRLVVR